MDENDDGRQSPNVRPCRVLGEGRRGGVADSRRRTLRGDAERDARALRAHAVGHMFVELR